MVDMVDPSRQTDVVRGYSYRQLLTRPVVGGGFITALAVPLIDAWGLPVFTIVTAAITVVADGLGHAPGGQPGRPLSRAADRGQSIPDVNSSLIHL